MEAEKRGGWKTLSKGVKFAVGIVTSTSRFSGWEIWGFAEGGVQSLGFP